MMDFTQSLKIGLQAAQAQIEKRNEIQTIFRHLSEQISQHLQFDMVIYPSEPDNDGYQRLYLADKSYIEKRGLAWWKDTDGAYPCLIRYDNEEFLCEDKKDLELALSTMLQNADIAEKLLDFKAESEIPF